MQLFEAVANLLVALTSLGVLVAIVVGLAASFAVWYFAPLDVDRGAAAAIAFVVAFVGTLLVWQAYENSVENKTKQ